MTDNRRWFLRQTGIFDMPWVEVTKAQWLAAERSAGFIGGGPNEPATGGFTGMSGLAGLVRYSGLPMPPNAVELNRAEPEVSYEWGVESLGLGDMPGGDVIWEDDGAGAEDRARASVNSLNRRAGGTARLVRRRIETYGWEEVE